MAHKPTNRPPRRQSAKQKANAQLFGQIPAEIIKRAYEAGKKGAIRPTYKKLWHDSYRSLK